MQKVAQKLVSNRLEKGHQQFESAKAEIPCYLTDLKVDLLPEYYKCYTSGRLLARFNSNYDDGDNWSCKTQYSINIACIYITFLEIIKISIYSCRKPKRLVKLRANCLWILAEIYRQTSSLWETYPDLN